MTTMTMTKTRVSFLLTTGGYVVAEMSDGQVELLREALMDGGTRWIGIPGAGEVWINIDHIVRIDMQVVD